MEEVSITPAILQRTTSYLNLLTHNFSSNLPRLLTTSTSYTETSQNEDPHEGGGGPMLMLWDNYQSYSKPFVVLDIIWNLGFVLVSTFVLMCTIQERPSSPLRVWIVGYSLQCVLHVAFLCFQFRRRAELGLGSNVNVSGSGGQPCSSIMKKLESANTAASSFWWMIGLYLIIAGGESLLQNSPRLYWLTIIFLALDVFFMIFCVGLVCIICLALFCCIPVLAIAYAMTIREGASEDEIRRLPKCIFRYSYTQKMSASMDLEKHELDLHFADSECCICLTRYVDGAELCTLPCNHHFHHECISRWLRINATCPLCKFNIKAKGDALV